MTMNRYGVEAQAYWQRFLPQRYAAIPDPQAHFTALGEQIEQQVGDLWDELVKKDQAPAGESHLERVGRLQQLKENAERIVFDDVVRLPPEEGTSPGDDEGRESDDSFRQRLQAFDRQLEDVSTLCEALTEGRLRVADLTDEQLKQVIDYMTPAFLTTLGTSLEAERAKGRAV